jgi:CAAX protease family protein
MDQPLQQRRIAMCVAPAMVLPLLASLFYFVWFADHPVARYLYSATKVFTLAWPLFVVLWLTREGLPLRRLWQRRHLRAVPLGLLTGFVIGGLILVGYYFTPLGEHVADHKAEIEAQLQNYNLIEHYVPFAIFLAALHSLIEEYFWRWYIFGSLAKILPLRAAYPLAAAAFAAHHFVVLGMYFPVWSTILFGVGVGVGGAIWCWQCQRQGSLVGAWISHALVDAAFLYVGYEMLIG